MIEQPLQSPLTTQELQARLVSELGDGYRFTARTIQSWASRPDHPLPSTRSNNGQRAHYRFDWDEALEWIEQEADRQENANPEFLSSVSSGIQVTVRALSRELEMAPETLLGRLRDWNIRPVDRRTVQGGAVDYYQLKHIFDALTASARIEDPDSLPAGERDAYYRSEQRKDDLRKSRGELIQVDDARMVLADLVEIRSNFYDLIPDRLQRHIGLTPEALTLIETEIDKLRAEEAATLADLHKRLQPHAIAEVA